MYSNPPMDYPYHTPSYHPWSIPPTHATNPSFTTPTTPSFPSFPWELFTPCYIHGSSSPSLYPNHGYSPHPPNPNPYSSYSSSSYSYDYNSYHQQLQPTNTSFTLCHPYQTYSKNRRDFDKYVQVTHPSFKKHLQVSCFKKRLKKTVRSINRLSSLNFSLSDISKTLFFDNQLNCNFSPFTRAAFPKLSSKTFKKDFTLRVVTEKVIVTDLGTTDSAVAAMEGGKPTIITNAEGQRTTPSVVAYTKNGDRLVGQIATRQAVVNPENKFFSAKRFIVRKMSEVDDKSKVSYIATRDDNGNVKLNCPAIGKSFATEKISAQVLRKLVDGASEFLNDKITKVVVIVPAYFDGLQRTHEPASSMSLVVSGHVESSANYIGPTIVDKLAYEVSGENMHFGTPKNPVVLNRVWGDSSSGTTVAVAANFVDFSLGIDTSGDQLFDEMPERAPARIGFGRMSNNKGNVGHELRLSNQIDYPSPPSGSNLHSDYDDIDAVGESDSEFADVVKGWASVQSIPRMVKLDKKTGRNLLQWPVTGKESLRLRSDELKNLKVKLGAVLSKDIKTAAQLDVVAEFEIEALEKTTQSNVEYKCNMGGGAFRRGALGPFGFYVLADDDLSEYTTVYFYVVTGARKPLIAKFRNGCYPYKRSLNQYVGLMSTLTTKNTNITGALLEHPWAMTGSGRPPSFCNVKRPSYIISLEGGNTLWRGLCSGIVRDSVLGVVFFSSWQFLLQAMLDQKAVGLKPPSNSGVEQLVEIIKVLGTQTKEEIRCMDPNNNKFEFPQIKAHSWHKFFHKRMPSEALDLVSRLLQYSPHTYLNQIIHTANDMEKKVRKNYNIHYFDRPLLDIYSFINIYGGNKELKVGDQSWIYRTVVTFVNATYFAPAIYFMTLPKLDSYVKVVTVRPLFLKELASWTSGHIYTKWILGGADYFVSKAFHVKQWDPGKSNVATTIMQCYFTTLRTRLF